MRDERLIRTYSLGAKEIVLFVFLPLSFWRLFAENYLVDMSFYSIWYFEI